MERLRLSKWRVCEVRVGRAQVFCELVQRVASDEDADRHIEDAVLGVELLDDGATAARRLRRRPPGDCGSVVRVSCPTWRISVSRRGYTITRSRHRSVAGRRRP